MNFNGLVMSQLVDIKISQRFSYGQLGGIREHFSNFNMHLNPLGILLTCSSWDFCIPNELPVGAHTAGLGTHFENQIYNSGFHLTVHWVMLLENTDAWAPPLKILT